MALIQVLKSMLVGHYTDSKLLLQESCIVSQISVMRSLFEKEVALFVAVVYNRTEQYCTQKFKRKTLKICRTMQRKIYMTNFFKYTGFILCKFKIVLVLK